MSRDLRDFAVALSQGINNATNVYIRAMDRQEARADRRATAMATWAWRQQQLARDEKKMAQYMKESDQRIKFMEQRGANLGRGRGGGGGGGTLSPAAAAAHAKAAREGNVISDTDQYGGWGGGWGGSTDEGNDLLGGTPMPPAAFGDYSESEPVEQPANFRAGGSVGAIDTNGPYTLGTSGPGQGFGTRAAPPIRRFQKGGSAGDDPIKRAKDSMEKSSDETTEETIPVPIPYGAVSAKAQGDRANSVLWEGSKAIGEGVRNTVRRERERTSTSRGKASSDDGPSELGAPKSSSAEPPAAAPVRDYGTSYPESGTDQPNTPVSPPRPSEAITTSAPAATPSQGSQDQYSTPTTPAPVHTSDGKAKDAPAAVSTGGRGGGGGGGGRAASARPKPRLGLGDQRRTEFYDPEADMADPRNIHAVDRWGRARVKNIPVTPALQSGVDYATQLFKLDRPQNGSAQGYGALISGTGTPDPQTMEQLFRSVDPQNHLPMDIRVEKALEVINSQAPPEMKGKLSFEVMQFANNMAKRHGMAALQLVEKGDLGGAVQQLMAGYNWLPNGWKANIAPDGSSVVIEDGKGGIAQTIPVNSETVKNFAFGMGVGELGWDVMRAPQQRPGPYGSAPTGGGGAPPAALPPPVRGGAAPPTAASGAGTAPPAAITPAAPVAPATSAGPSQPPAPTTPSAVPVPPTSQAPQPSTVPSGEAGATPTPPPAAVDTSGRGGGQGMPPPPEMVLGRNAPEQPRQPPGPVEFDRIPRGVGPIRLHTTPIDVRREMQGLGDPTYQKDMIEYNTFRQRAANDKERRDIDKLIAQRTRTHNERMKEARDKASDLRKRQEALDKDEKARQQPRQLSSSEEDRLATDTDQRIDELVADKDQEKVQRSLLRFLPPKTGKATPESDAIHKKVRAPLASIARNLHMHNPTMDGRQAVDAAVTMTGNVGDNETGYNGRKGKDGAWFRPLGPAYNENLVVVATKVDGVVKRILMPQSTLRTIGKLRADVGKNIDDEDYNKKKKQAEADRDAATLAAGRGPSSLPLTGMPMQPGRHNPFGP